MKSKLLETGRRIDRYIRVLFPKCVLPVFIVKCPLTIIGVGFNHTQKSDEVNKQKKKKGKTKTIVYYNIIMV